MKKQSVLPSRMSQREFDRRAEQIRQEIQKSLPPEQATRILAINVETGEYVLTDSHDDAWETFQERWPAQLAYVVRVDGGPVVKFHGK
jgi:hypothetical protein